MHEKLAQVLNNKGLTKEATPMPVAITHCAAGYENASSKSAL